MNRATPNATACREALSRLTELNLRELRQHWRALYKADASPHLSHELLSRLWAGAPAAVHADLAAAVAVAAHPRGCTPPAWAEAFLDSLAADYFDRNATSPFGTPSRSFPRATATRFCSRPSCSDIRRIVRAKW